MEDAGSTPALETLNEVFKVVAGGILPRGGPDLEDKTRQDLSRSDTRRGIAARGAARAGPPSDLKRLPVYAATRIQMDIQEVLVSEIITAPYNPRVALRPGDPMYEHLRKSIDEFGLVEPLVWNKRTRHLVGGHQRLAVLIAQGVKSVLVVVVDLPIEKEKALNIALNKIQSDWDQNKLAELLGEFLQTPEFDMDLTGFELDEATDIVSEFLGEEEAGIKKENLDAKAALESAGPTVTQPGDLIVLGKDPKLQHRLLCGDSTNHEHVRRLMDGARAALFATDPPYLVDYTGANHPGANAGVKNKDWSDTYGVTWDDADENSDLYDKFIGAAVAEALRPNSAWYCWHASRRQAMLESVWNKHGAFVHCQIIWVKNRPVLTRTLYMWQHEPCLMGWVKGNLPPKTDAEKLSTVWQIDTIPNGDERPDHPTPKPLEIFELPMRQHTRRGDVCYEPFAGSGTQFIAAERLGRRCFGLEISPVYCDLIVRRFIAFAGEQSVLPEIAEKYRVAKEVTA